MAVHGNSIIYWKDCPVLLVVQGRFGRNEEKHSCAALEDSPIVTPSCLTSSGLKVCPHNVVGRGRDGGWAPHGPTCMLLWVFVQK